MAAQSGHPLLTGGRIRVGDLVERFYSDVTRYTTSAFMHMKFGEALRRRGVAPHIYESRAEAEAHLFSLTGGSAPAGRQR